MSFWSRNGLVVLVCLIAAALHFHFSKEKRGALRLLNARLQEMEIALQAEQRNKGNLELQIASQNDPAWIEMVLIRELGVVPEGFLKVHFKK